MHLLLLVIIDEGLIFSLRVFTAVHVVGLLLIVLLLMVIDRLVTLFNLTSSSQAMATHSYLVLSVFWLIEIWLRRRLLLLLKL